jgi:hypothetical protein
MKGNKARSILSEKRVANFNNLDDIGRHQNRFRMVPISRTQSIATLAGEMYDYTTKRILFRTLVEISEKFKYVYRGDEGNQHMATEPVALHYKTLEFYLSFEETVTRCAFYLAHAIMKLISYLVHTTERNQDALDYLADFGNKYPEFNIPNLGERIYGIGCKASSNLGNRELESFYSAKYENSLRNCPFIATSTDNGVQLEEVDDPNWQRDWK